MESIFNLTSLNGLEGLKHFFGNTFLIKQGKSYVLVGDDNLNRAEFGKSVNDRNSLRWEM